MGINPDTYAPASPSSSAGGGGGAGFPVTRHMAQWESARLEAEARLSRESLLFSSASSAAAVSAADSEPADDSLPTARKPESDFFLRIWNSEIGDAFRKPLPSALPSSAAEEATTAPTAESKSCASAGGEAPSAPDSSSSNELDETSDETYQLYLNLAGDELGLFHGQMSGTFSLFSADLNDVVFLDTAFK